MTRRLRKLSPTGRRISTTIDLYAEAWLERHFQPYSSQFYDSGTSALAAGIFAAKQSKRCARPEVLIPAYACPDLVSAARFAGVEVKLIDFERDRPWMDLNHVRQMLTENTVAIVAVNFLGIPERIVELKDVARRVGAVVIEDSALAYPYQSGQSTWSADVVVLSFGRGKPVSLLGGGAILIRNGAFSSNLPVPPCGNSGSKTRRWLGLQRIKLFNLLVQPNYYWVTALLPFLSLGETVYKPLCEIGKMPDWLVRLVPPNIQAYQSELETGCAESVNEIVQEVARDSTNIIDLPTACGISDKRCLLRYPVLLSPEHRDVCFRKYGFSTLGCSMLYKNVLPRIKGVRSNQVQESRQAEAQRFANRLMTVPVHMYVGSGDLAYLRESLLEVAS